MAKVNGVPGFTNFKKVNILDTFLIQGQPVSADTTLDNDEYLQGTEFDGVTTRDLIGIDTADNVIIGNQDNINIWRSANGRFQLDTLSNSGTPLGQLEFYEDQTSFIGFIGFNGDIAQTLQIRNVQTNQDIDLITSGTGQVLINGSPIGAGFDPTANYNITGDWVWQTTGSLTWTANTPMEFQLPETEDNILFNQTTDDFQMWIYYGTDGVDNEFRFEPGSGSIKDGGNRFGYDFDNEVWFADVSIGVKDAGAFLLEDSSNVFQSTLFYDTVPAPDTVVLTNSILNGDVDIRTSGTGQFLVNGSPISSFTGFDMANNEFLTGEDLGTTPRNLIGVNTSDVIQIGSTLAYSIAGLGGLTTIKTLQSSGQDFVQLGEATAKAALQGGNTGRVAVLQDSLGSAAFFGFPASISDPLASERARMGFTTGTNDFVIENLLTGADVDINATGTGDILVTSGTGSFTVSSGGNFRIQATSVEASLWYAAQGPQITTVDRTATGAGSGATVVSPPGVARAIGFNAANINTEAGNFTVAVNTPGETYNYTGAGGNTATLGAATNWHPESMQMIFNAGSGSLTIATSGGDTLTWFDGSTTSTGSRTLAAGGLCTIYNFNSSNHRIWGIGLT